MGRLTTPLALLGFLLVLMPAEMAAFQENPAAEAAAVQVEPAGPGTEEAPAEVIHPGPQSLKERWGIGVFLVWMWLSIGVLVYFILLQIREADRVKELGYDSPVMADRDKRTP